MPLLRSMTVLLLVGLMGCAGARAAETVLADPPPSFDNPRHIMLQLTSSDPQMINNILYNAVNLQKFYGQDNVRIAIVAFGAGMEALYEKTTPVKDRITSLQQYDVEFVACGNTLETTGHTEDELIDGVTLVTAGIAEIVERQLRGWIYVRP
ncbi:DsrE family protein [Indioceanicola profundi]|uniref:DsrE family protein n=1 Tax=Indioceanicola profundi TaxID=2220096 RepID=UPI0013C46036|nr:DsrE family protein [Indioceanicola profundi]